MGFLKSADVKDIFFFFPPVLKHMESTIIKIVW